MNTKYHHLSASYKINSQGKSSESIEEVSIQSTSEEKITSPTPIYPPPIPPPPIQRANVIPGREWSLLTSGQAVGVSGLNTHYFDGKFTSFLSLIEPKTSEKISLEIIRASKVEKEEKHKLFLDLENKILSLPSEVVTNHAKHCLRTIINTHEMLGRGNIPSNPNYSESDKLFACDLLFLLSEKIVLEGNEEYLNLLVSQLDEMITGLCPQGRVNRLFQTYVMLRDDLTETSK